MQSIVRMERQNQNNLRIIHNKIMFLIEKILIHLQSIQHTNQ